MDRKRVLIIGAGIAGKMVLQEIIIHRELNCKVVGFIDDDPQKLNTSFLNTKVLGTRNDIERVVKEYGVEEVIIAIPSAKGQVIRDIIKHCERIKVKFKIVPGIFEIIEGNVSISQVREVQVDDLLGRKEVRIDPEAVASYICDKRVLVTGAGGSIGSELCRQSAGFKPALLTLLDRDENSIYHIDMEMRRTFPDLPMATVICDVKDRDKVGNVLRRFRPDVIFHAAAYKHVSLMEDNPDEAIKNNVLGTRVIAEAADEFGVERFVFISTDKAVNPTSVYGASKRLAEMVIQGLAGREGRLEGRPTKFMAVRFGNVMGSRGSIIPLFKEQIASGGPVTVTHPDVVRYFMTIPEAVQLVMEAAAVGKGGEVFVLDMGEPVRILDLAKDMIVLSGFEPGRDIEIKFIGLKPGEKLREEVLTAEEGLRATKYEKIFVTRPERVDYESLCDDIDELVGMALRVDLEGMISKLREIIPTYHPPEMGTRTSRNADIDAKLVPV
ncbi:MAG: polysaccharide biosynthesis protein [bacterium]